MDPAAYHPGPVNGYLLTLQDSHSTSFVWNSSEELPDLRVRTNFGEYWNAVHENRPPQAIMDAINDAGVDIRAVHYISSPTHGHTPDYLPTCAKEDQLRDMESAIDPATLDIGRAQRIVQGLLGRFRGSRNPSRHRGRPPVTPVEPEPGTYYTHVGSSSSDRGGWSHLVGTSSSPVGDVAGTSRADGWGSWPESTVRPSTYAGDDYEGGPCGFTVRLEDDQDMSAEGQSQESYQFQDADAYRPDMSFLRDQYTTPPPQVPVPSFASQSYIFGAPAFPFAPPPVRSTPTPIQMSTFASYTGESSPWAPPSTAVPGHSEAEEQPEDEHQQQPPRAAKGKGRRCHTGSHIFGHKKK
ncbi:hypothetical protein ACET3Z_028594 [Daucus carota]